MRLRLWELLKEHWTLFLELEHRHSPVNAVFLQIYDFFFILNKVFSDIKRRAAPQQTKASKTERARLTNHPAVRIYWRDAPKPALSCFCWLTDLDLINMISSSLWQVAYCCLSHTNKNQVSSCTWRVAGSINVLGQPGGEVIRRVDVSSEPKLQQEPFELSSAYFWSTVIVLILVILVIWCNRVKHNTESQREGIIARYMIHIKAMDVLRAQVS